MIPITSVSFGHEEEQRVLEVIRSGMIAQGPVVAEFEQQFAKIAGTKHAIAVNNGTTSLIASIQVLDLQPGDEVITSPFTFVATLNAILEAGATAVFADIREDDFNMDPANLRELITPRTRAIMPVHLYGQMADMDPIVELAEAHGLMIIEDSAQSHGAQYKGRPAGSYGLGSFSFYATKNLTTGEGGMVTTNSDELAEKLRILRNQGMRARYEYVMAGNNYRLTDLQAALVLPQLARYEGIVEQRQRNAQQLNEGLDGVPGLHLPQQLEGRRHVWHQYTVRLDESAALSRDEFVAALGKAGIGCGIYYPKVVFDYDTYRSNPLVRAAEVPVAFRVAAQSVSLPVHGHLSQDDLDTIIATVRRLLGAQ